MGGSSWDSNIANLWKDNFSAIVNSVGSTDNRDQVMKALGTVPGHNDIINVHELRQIVRGHTHNTEIPPFADWQLRHKMFFSSSD